MSSVGSGYPCAIAADAPIRMKSTPCRCSAARTRRGSNVSGSPGLHRPLHLAVDARPVRGMLEPLERRQLEVSVNPLVIGVVVVREPEADVEPAAADELAQ